MRDTTTAIKIKNIKAGTLFGYNLGIREYYDYKGAMLCNSLFLDFLLAHGLKVRGKSTRDVICLDFDFGSRSYEEELASVKDKPDADSLRERIEANKDKYCKKSKDEIRELFYTEGVSIDYGDEVILYRMLYRNPSKAKTGQVMFINDKLYKAAHKWLTMNLKMPLENAKIVELSAYMTLTTSTIEDKTHIPVEDVLIVKDQSSIYRTLVKKVYAKDGQCLVEDDVMDVENVLWDGMALIESSICPSYTNGMVLLRQHFFKACAFKTNIQLFFKDYCKENGYDYENHVVTDMFGVRHKLKDIKMITTNNAIKWLKFKDIMGKDPYEYWKRKVNKDGSYFGIVKTDHPSKLGEVQQMSYQMINTLPCSPEDILELASNSIEYVEDLKTDPEEFCKYLDKNANISNHYEMMAALYRQNPDFVNSTWFRNEKKKVISGYVNRLKKGKITINADNLTLCGNPYALLLFTVGEDFMSDPTLNYEDGAIQCYTKRFKDGEYLCGIRNPHNSPNNLCYLHNRYSEEMNKYFDFSENILAVNCIKTDIQSRANGCDFDSDFFFVTNNHIMVESCKLAQNKFPTIVNALKESGIKYNNTMSEYAKMDNKFAKAQMGIGESSNLAQLAMTYYWTKPSRELYNNFVILSVLAQVLIDGCKREYEVDGVAEIKRIRKMECMNPERDFPMFMKYTRDIPITKNGKPRAYELIKQDKDKLSDRLNWHLYCPMNCLLNALETIQGAPRTKTIPTIEFLNKIKGQPNNRQMGKIRAYAEECSYRQFLILKSDEEFDVKITELELLYDEMLKELSKIKITNPKTINRLIETALTTERHFDTRAEKNAYTRCTRTLLKLLFRMDKEKFLSNFTTKNAESFKNDVQNFTLN